ncbi:putative transmembrane anti-sigma factor [Candidatus Sulfopaludibacter sp. SbA3]|nr:putative transmembrane anti-sigma factor [Candidatus Sulfopaludibacter sp. SbA3]
MNCAELEVLICDYVDGTLDTEQKAVVEQHLAACPPCAELARDSAAAVAFMARAADVEPPPELVNRILFDAPWSKEKSQSKAREWMRAILSPILQPRFAMGIALTMLSLSIIAQGKLPKFKASDLRPAAIWLSLEGRVDYAVGRTIKFYNDLKVVYQIQTMLHEWQQQSEDQPATVQKSSEPKTDERKLPVRTAPDQTVPAKK